MWMYLAVGLGILVALNLLVVLVVAVMARRAEPGDEFSDECDEFRDELSTELRARLEEYVQKAA